MNKIRSGAAEALRGIHSGASIAAGGFGLCGIPELCIAALAQMNVRDLHIVSNNCGVDDFGLGLLLRARQIRRLICSYVGENAELERQLIAGEVEVELTPQGTLAERLRAAGAGIPAFYTPTGVATQIAKGKEIREFDGRSYLMETALPTDWAIVKAWRGDRHGNLQYRLTARNFNPACAMAARVTVAEVEEIVEVGEIPRESVDTPGIYVQHVIVGHHAKRIEALTVRPSHR